MDVPPPKALPNFPEGGLLPYCIVADEVFPLRLEIMRPYPRLRRNTRLPHDEQIFNYRLSRACHIVENAFGILVQRWRIFSRKIALLPDNVKACCILHNYLSESIEIPTIFNQLNPEHDPYLSEDGAILDVREHGFHHPQEARAMRDFYKVYFNHPEGAVT